jgi:uncharacterized membrane protein YidH (DUF202 family)
VTAVERRPDTGLQPERTAMAWQRTALTAAGVSALTLRHAEGDVLRSLPGLLGLAGAVGLLLVVEGRYLRMLRHAERGDEPLGRRLVVLLTLGCVLLSLGALLVVLSGPGGQ